MTFKEIQEPLLNGKKFKYNKWEDGTEYIFMENNIIKLFNPDCGVICLNSDVLYLYKFRNEDDWEEYI